MRINANRTLAIIVILGLIQGLMLLLGQQLVQRAILSGSDLYWRVPWYAVALGVPTALQLIVRDLHDRRVWGYGLVLLGVLTLTGVYTGLVVYPGPDASNSVVVTPYVLTMLIGWFVSLPFVQSYLKTGRLRPPYADLFDFAWNNLITLKIAAVFTGIFWGLLALWAALFKVIGIGLFDRVFYHVYFSLPVSSIVFAFALYVGRTNVQAVVTVRRIILAIFKGLLPLLAIIIVLFVLALPFMGLKPLWATGKATALMLTLQVFLVVFINAVFQDGGHTPPYPAWLRGALRGALMLLPVYTLLCAYALYLRIDQHGWSTDRFWAVLLALITGLYVFGYAYAALRRSPVWMQGMAPVNIAIAGLVVLLSVLVNSPLLDAHRLSAHSQVARLLAGRVTEAHFDYDYLRFDLGKAGKVALERLRDIQGHPEADKIHASALAALAKVRRWGPQIESVDTVAQLRTHLMLYPQGAMFDEAFLHHLLTHKTDWQLQLCFAVNRHCPVLAMDMNNDGQVEYLVFSIESGANHNAAVFSRQPVWRRVGWLNRLSDGSGESLEQLEQALARGDVATVSSPWRDLRVGRFRQVFNEE